MLVSIDRPLEVVRNIQKNGPGWNIGQTKVMNNAKKRLNLEPHYCRVTVVVIHILGRDQSNFKGSFLY